MGLSFLMKENESGESFCKVRCKDKLDVLSEGSSCLLVRIFSCIKKQKRSPGVKISPVKSVVFPSQKMLALALTLYVAELFALDQPHMNSLEKSTGILMLYWIKARKSNILYLSFPSYVHKMISFNSDTYKIIYFFFSSSKHQVKIVRCVKGLLIDDILP